MAIRSDKVAGWHIRPVQMWSASNDIAGRLTDPRVANNDRRHDYLAAHSEQVAAESASQHRSNEDSPCDMRHESCQTEGQETSTVRPLCTSNTPQVTYTMVLTSTARPYLTQNFSRSFAGPIVIIDRILMKSVVGTFTNRYWHRLMCNHQIEAEQ